MASEYERRLRTTILKVLAKDRRKFDDDLRDEDVEAIFEDFNEISSAEFDGVVGNFEDFLGSEKVYRLLASSGDGLYFNVYTIVDQFYQRSEKEMERIERIKTIFAFIEGATAMIYNARYGEDGIEFNVPEPVIPRLSDPPLSPAEKIREEFAKLATAYKQGEMDPIELDQKLDEIVPLR
jgi:hypothetical protein